MNNLSIEKNGIQIPIAQVELISGKEQVVLGNYDRDLILRTKGNIKVQVGSKFFDLQLSETVNGVIVDSNNNALTIVDNITTGQTFLDNSFVFVRSTNVLYAVDQGTLKPITSNSSSGSNPGNNGVFVSYKENQELTGEEKRRVLFNIGYVSNSLSDLYNTDPNLLYNDMVVFSVAEGMHYQLLDSTVPQNPTSWKALYLSLKDGGVVKGQVVIDTDNVFTNDYFSNHIESDSSNDYLPLPQSNIVPGLSLGKSSTNQMLKVWNRNGKTIFGNTTNSGISFVENINNNSIPTLDISNGRVGIGGRADGLYKLLVNGNSKFTDYAYLTRGLQSVDQYTPGIVGTGFDLSKAGNGDWNFEIDNLIVRKQLNFRNLNSNKTIGVNGQFWFSNVHAVDTVTYIKSYPVYVNATSSGRYYKPAATYLKVPLSLRGTKVQMVHADVTTLEDDTITDIYSTIKLPISIGDLNEAGASISLTTYNQGTDLTYHVPIGTHMYDSGTTSYVPNVSGTLVAIDTLRLVKVDFNEKHNIILDDLLMFKRWDDESKEIQYAYIHVIRVSGNSIYCHIFNSIDLESGTEIVKIGNLTTPSNVSLIDASDDEGTLTYLEGVDTFNDIVKERYYVADNDIFESPQEELNVTKANTRLGDLSRITDNDLLLDGTYKFGSYFKSGYFKGNAVLNAGKVGNLYLLDGKLLTRTGITDRSQFTTNGDEFYNTTGSGLYIDAKSNRFSLGDRLRYSGNVLTLHTLLVDGTNNASAGVGRGSYITSVVNATANSDLLIGVDIAPTLSMGAFTGGTLLAVRFGGNISPSADNLYVNGSSVWNWSAVRTRVVEATTGALVAGTTTNNNFDFKSNAITNARLFGSGNWLFQKGGTLTDSGAYQIDFISATSAQGVRIRNAAFANLDLWSDRTSGNIGGIRYIDTTTGSPRVEMNADVNGTWYVSNATSGAVVTRLRLLPNGHFMLDGTGVFSDDGARFQVVGNETAAAGGIKIMSVRGSTIASANNDTLVGIDLAPTFNIGAFTGVTNIAMRVTASTVLGVLVRNPDANSRSAIAVQDSGQTRYIELIIKGTTSTNGGDYGNNGEGVLRSSTGATGMALSIVSGNLRFITTGSGTEQARMFNNGNWVFGGTTDNGYKIDAFGNTRLNGRLEVTASGGNIVSRNLDAAGNSTIEAANDLNTAAIAVGIRNSTNSGSAVNFGIIGEAFVRASANTTGLLLASSSTNPIRFMISSTELVRLFSTGNLLIQTGGTPVDAGYKLDVNGTTRIQNTLTLSNLTAGFVRTSAAGVISSSPLVAADLPSGSNNYIQNQSAGDQTASLRINGTIAVNSFSRIFANSYTNYAQGNNTSLLAQTPMGAIWHDLFAFTRYSPTFETSVDGTAWVSGTVDKKLFSMKENQSITVLNPGLHQAVRWTWNGVAWSGGAWLVLGHTYSSPSPNKTILIESSVDGIVWTQRHTSTYSNTADTMYHYVTSFGGDNYLRLTMTHISATANLNLSSIKLLSSRPGDQGLGREYEFPYLWDENRNLTLQGNLTTGYQIISSVATGTSPFAITSTTLNTNLNADMLDNQHGSWYQDLGNATGSLADARLSSNVALKNINNAFSVVQHIIASNSTTATHYLELRPSDYGTGKPAMFFKKDTVADKWFIGLWDNATNGGTLDFTVTNLTKGGSTIWHSGNDGIASGLDADLLDAQQGSYYLDYNNQANKATGLVYGVENVDAHGTGITWYGSASFIRPYKVLAGASNFPGVGHGFMLQRDAVNTAEGIGSTHFFTKNSNEEDWYLKKSTQSSFPFFTAWRKIIHDGNLLANLLLLDGASSGIDSDMLDGQHGSFYQNASNINTGTLANTRGGTGLAAIGTALQVLRVNSGATALEYAALSSKVMNGSGVDQFTYLIDGGFQITGGGDTSVSFDATNKRITITSVPGAGGGGAVTSFNGRTGGVVATEGDYSLNLLGDVTITGVSNDQLLKYNSAATRWENWTPNFLNASNFVTEYISSAIPNGSTVTFTTANNYVSGTTKVFLNGLRMYKGASFDYTESAANAITFNYAPIAGDLIIIDYQK